MSHSSLSAKMLASSLLFSGLSLASVAFSNTDNCDFRLDQRVFDGAFSWTNSNLKNAVVLFSRTSAGNYKVQGVYKRGSDQNYHLFRDYLATWPTYAGRGESASVRDVRFQKEANRCLIEFVGQKSVDPAADEIYEPSFEIYRASFDVTKEGLAITWPESTDALKFSSVPRSRIIEK